MARNTKHNPIKKSFLIIERPIIADDIALLEVIKANPGLDAYTLAEKLHRNVKTIQRSLAWMELYGIIRHTPPENKRIGRYGRPKNLYYLKKDPIIKASLDITATLSEKNGTVISRTLEV